MSSEQDILTTIPDDDGILGVAITVQEIQAKIALLSQLPGEDLKGAMGDLKRALKANPEACNLLLPEEIGALVSALYKTTNQKIMIENTKATIKVSKKVDLSKVDLNQLKDF